MEVRRAFAPVARALRDSIIEQYRDRGTPLDHPAGRRTLDTNSILVPERAELLLDFVRGRGMGHLEGAEVVDLGCGFGAVSLYLALAGARVTGIDPDPHRLEVGRAVAATFGLQASFQRGWMEAAPLPSSAFHLVVLNNSLCYVTDRSDRREALRNAHRIAKPQGRLVLRDPDFAAPVDPFTGLPLIHQLPARFAGSAARWAGRPRSDLRLTTTATARRELRRAGFCDVRRERPADGGRLSRHHHLTALRPASPAGCAGA